MSASKSYNLSPRRRRIRNCYHYHHLSRCRRYRQNHQFTVIAVALFVVCPKWIHQDFLKVMEQ